MLKTFAVKILLRPQRSEGHKRLKQKAGPELQIKNIWSELAKQKTPKSLP
jgi:hypothetical protein